MLWGLPFKMAVRSRDPQHLAGIDLVRIAQVIGGLDCGGGYAIACGDDIECLTRLHDMGAPGSRRADSPGCARFGRHFQNLVTDKSGSGS